MGINSLTVDLDDFKLSTKPFAKRREKLGTVLLAYECGFLSIESGDIKVVINATGKWHGRASFSPEILRALATVPPSINPLRFEYEDGYLTIGATKIPCTWETVSASFIENFENPSLLALLALEKTMPRVEIGGTELGKEVIKARMRAERKILSAATQLEELEISEEDIRNLLEKKLARKTRLI
jgi:seryl-tRNA(Sec) selenium transferase